MKASIFKKIIKEKLFCGLDIGSSSIKASLIKAKEANAFEIIGICENKIFGLKDGFVVDLADFSECVHEALNELSERTGFKIQDLQVGLSSQLVEIRKSSAVIPLVEKGSKVIISRDIKTVTEHARLLGLKMDEEILHEMVQSYQADDVSLGPNPLGLYGRKLGVQMLMIIANVNKIRNIIKGINQAGYDIDNLFYSSYAASEVILSDKEKAEGSVLIDIGANATSVFIFRQKTLKDFGIIPIGGSHFTKSIAEALNVSFDLAEQIKQNHADVLKVQPRLEEEILIKRESVYMPIKREALFMAMEGYADHLIQRVTGIIKESGYADQINCGITAIGGGALLNGLIERISQAQNATVRLGRINIKAQENSGNHLAFLQGIGVSMCGYQKSRERNIFYSSGKGWKKDFINKLMELYQEYF